MEAKELRGSGHQPTTPSPKNHSFSSSKNTTHGLLIELGQRKEKKWWGRKEGEEEGGKERRYQEKGCGGRVAHLWGDGGVSPPFIMLDTKTVLLCLYCCANAILLFLDCCATAQRPTPKIDQNQFSLMFLPPMPLRTGLTHLFILNKGIPLIWIQ